MTHEFEDTGTTRISSTEQIDLDLLEHGTLRLDKHPRLPSPDKWKGFNLEQDTLGFAKGADAVYRDNRQRNSLQVREYDTYYTIQLDHANLSQGEFIQHYQLDIGPSQKVKIVGGVLVLALAGWAITN